MNIKIYIYVLILFCASLKAQSFEWQTYTTSNSPMPDNQVQAITINKNNVKWIGTTKGLVRLDSAGWQVFNTSNSGIPSDQVYSLLSEDDGVWVGTSNGLARFDGSGWSKFNNADTVFTSSLILEIVKDKENNLWVMGEQNLVKFNSTTLEVLLNWEAIGSLSSLAIDSSGIVWLGDFSHADFNGLLWNLDGTRWTYHKMKEFPELISSFPYAITVDNNNTVWMGFGGTVGGGIVKIANSRWDIFKELNSGFPGGAVYSILIKDKVKWIGCGKGLVTYDDVNWQLFDTTNSGLKSNWVYSLAEDIYGNKWIGTIGGGVSVYNEGGITSAEDKSNITGEFNLYNNYPNPFNPSTKIKYMVGEDSHITLDVYNMLGEKVSLLFTGNKIKGEYEATFDASALPSGIYFCRMTAQSSAGNNKYIQTMKMVCVK